MMKKDVTKLLYLSERVNTAITERAIKDGMSNNRVITMALYTYLGIEPEPNYTPRKKKGGHGNHDV